MNAPERFFLADVQSFPDARRLAIQHVGIRGLRFPLSLLGADGQVRPSIAAVAMGVALAAETKGTHMSRFIELMESWTQPMAPFDVLDLHATMLRRLGAEAGRIELTFPYFVSKAAPVSGVASTLDHDVTVVVEQASGDLPRLRLRVTTPVTSLCPCSKEISDYGAHNQRSHITIEAELRGALGIEDLIRLAEEEASCEVFGLLKRPDEKWVTERAYANPKFVEDLVRDIALRVMAEPRIGSWRVASENFESIHNHSAYAEIEGCNG